MRVTVGSVYHESNTFFSERMTMARFAEGHLHFGRDVLDHWAGTSSEIAGFMSAAAEFSFELVPTMMAWGMPSGSVTDDTFEELWNGLADRLRVASPLDGVLLSLHGAMVTETFADADGELLRRVRSVVGTGVPVVATLDLHANVTEDMVRWPDALVAYNTYPHVDQTDCGRKAGDILRRIMGEELRPSMALARRPLLPHILAQATHRAPMAEVMTAARKLEEDPHVLNVSVIPGFPYTDVPDAGLAVVVVGDAQQAASAAAESLASSIWERRAEFAAAIPLAEEAVRDAVSLREGLTVLVDIGDNVGAGTPGDGTILLKELLRQNAQGALVLLCDPDAVARCAQAGVRETVTLTVGGKCDRHHGEPIEIRGRVRLLSDGVYRNVGPMRDGVVDDQGRTAVVETDGLLLVLTERRMPMWNLEQLRALGIEPTRLRIIVVKAAVAFRAAYGPIASRIIEVDTPGLAAADVRRFEFHRLKRPIYPLDAI
jgi:microcystin degradation protein MlrC